MITTDNNRQAEAKRLEEYYDGLSLSHKNHIKNEISRFLFNNLSNTK